MWVFYALGAALFAGIVAILAKIGLQDVDADVATALRTVVVVIFAWLLVFAAGSQQTLGAVDRRSILFLVLSGLATGGSWLCYFKALQLGDVNKVVPVDKSSTILTIVLSALLLGERLSLIKGAALLLIGGGTYVMLERKTAAETKEQGRGWFAYAALSAVLASLTAILGKIGISGVEANLGIAVRTVVVLLMAWLIVLGKKKQRQIRQISGGSWTFIGLSGMATGLSWLCYYRALQEGPASIVVPIDKLSILVTVAFGYFILRERLSKKAFLGLLLLVSGTLLLLV